MTRSELIVLDALLWAWTNATGRLPDTNTMTATEIQDYWVEYQRRLRLAVQSITGQHPDQYLSDRAKR
jgi:cobalamin biosynthesis Mg chelatase CobN